MVQSNSFKLSLINDSSSTPPKEFDLTKSEIIIGRDDTADITIPASAVSRRHAKLTLEGGKYFLEDLGRSNGTFDNGENLTRRRLLNSGDKIRLGQIVNLVYEAPVSETESNTIIRSAESDKTVMRSVEPDNKTVLRATPAKPAHVMQTMMGEAPVLPQNTGPRELLVTIEG